MELNDLRLLLDKYENGETSVQEERELKVYFKSHDVSQMGFLGNCSKYPNHYEFLFV